MNFRTDNLSKNSLIYQKCAAIFFHLHNIIIVFNQIYKELTVQVKSTLNVNTAPIAWYILLKSPKMDKPLDKAVQ